MPKDCQSMFGFPPRLAIAGLLALTVVGCSGEEEVVEGPATRPVKTFVVEGSVTDSLRTFPGRVDANKRAELAFRVPGQLQKILVREGDLVEAGQVLAQLDPTDYQLVYEDRKASYDNAQHNFERAKELVGDGNISRMDFDTMEANYRSASAALSQAKKDLEYTVLSSPFAGRVAERRVENFEDVIAKQTAFSLQNIKQLDIIIDVPESVVRMVRAEIGSERTDAGGERTSATRATARFEGKPEEVFQLRPKEISTRANEQTQTFRATWTMDAPSNFTVLPGMTATVELDLSNLMEGETLRAVPVRAVQAGSSLEPRVWVLDPQTMTVSARAVTVGRMMGNMIQVVSGLQGGEEIVAVGAPYLAEGMPVTRMAKTEQAMPREGDPL